MKCLLRLTMLLCAWGAFVESSNAAFTSLQVFGDLLTSTTNGPGGSFYYGKRYTNGRVWVEVLAQRQGIPFDDSHNWSYFGHYSPNLLTNVVNYVPPADVATTLFVIWVNNADFVGHLADSRYSPYNTSKLAIWTSAINQSLSNHLEAVQTLYEKGARTIVMPNAVDVTKVPYYVGLPAADKAFLRQRVIDFNTGFSAMLAQARMSLPGITIYMPDFFSVLDDILARPEAYGLINALENGRSIDALSDPALSDKSLAGLGSSYLFWDYLDPSARAHAVIADVTQQLISPSRIDSLTLSSGDSLLDLKNLPQGLDGVVEGSADFAGWTAETSFSSGGKMQTVTFPAAGDVRFYRLRFPFAWTWP